MTCGDAGVTGVPARPRATTRTNPAGLTARQVDVLRLVAEGLTNAGIAARLFISEKTADHHVSAILAKLDVPTRREAAVVARSPRRRPRAPAPGHPRNPGSSRSDASGTPRPPGMGSGHRCGHHPDSRIVAGMDITLRHTRRADGVTDAVRDLAPVVLGLAPFAMLIGVTAVRSGLGAGTGVLSSALLLGGSGQLTALTMIAGGASPRALLAAVTLVNARFLLYAAALEPRFRDQPRWFRWVGRALRRRPHLRDGRPPR